MDYRFAPKWYVMAKPAGARCNLHCDYCYYLHSGGKDCADGETVRKWLEEYIRQYVQLTPENEEVVFCWHGGEPLLRPLSFYREAVRLQRAYAGRHLITNVIQTNGTLLTDEWCAFLHDEGWRVGVSIDGPEHVHNRYRNRSFGRVMSGIERLYRHRVDYTLMAVVTDYSAKYPQEVYDFLTRLGTPFLQLEPQCEAGSVGQVSAETFGNFCNTLFDIWYGRQDMGKVYIDLFEATLALLMGFPSPTCIYSERCGNAPVVEADGDVYACDHYVPRVRLGNLFETPLLDLLTDGRMQAFGARKMPTAAECKACPFLRLCYGGCPRHRDADGVNVLCEGYKAYFRHTVPRFQEMATTIRTRL